MVHELIERSRNTDQMDAEEEAELAELFNQQEWLLIYCLGKLRRHRFAKYLRSVIPGEGDQDSGLMPLLHATLSLMREDALAAAEQAVLERLPEGSLCASLTLTTDNRNAVHFVAVPGNAGTARHHASAHGLSSPGRQQLHRTVPLQLEGRGSLDGRVSHLGGSTSQHRSLDPGLQPRPASSRSPKSHPHEAFLAFTAVLNSEALTVSF
jgi:hypothetical protein